MVEGYGEAVGAQAVLAAESVVEAVAVTLHEADGAEVLVLPGVDRDVLLHYRSHCFKFIL